MILTVCWIRSEEPWSNRKYPVDNVKLRSNEFIYLLFRIDHEGLVG